LIIEQISRLPLPAGGKCGKYKLLMLTGSSRVKMKEEGLTREIAM
jgi:hypothetical protein